MLLILIIIAGTAALLSTPVPQGGIATAAAEPAPRKAWTVERGCTTGGVSAALSAPAKNPG